MEAGQSTPEAALDRIFELALRLNEVMQRGLAERGLSGARAEMLLVLGEAGPLVQRRLSESLRCTPRYVTALIDELEADGLLKRGPHPSDRRATLVSLTRRGSAAASRMAAERREAAQWLLGDASPGDLAAVVAIADQVLSRITTSTGPGTSPETRRRSRKGAR